MNIWITFPGRIMVEATNDHIARAVPIDTARTGPNRDLGLDRQVALTALRSEDLRSLIVSIEAQAAEMQVGGVPFFIVDRQWAVSGAQSAEQWVALIRRRQNA